MITENICVSFSSFFSKLAVLFIAYFTPIAEIIHVMLIFLTVDFISGIWASLKNKDKIQSNKLRRTVIKFIWYTVAVMAAWMMEKTFAIGWSNLASITGGFICFVELKSIFENITRITDEPIFSRIIKIFRKKGAETLSELEEEEKNSDHGTKT